MHVSLPILRSDASAPRRAADVDRLEALAKGTPPRSVRLSLIDRCDLACVYCRPHKKDGYFEKTLDLEAWKTIVRGLVAAGVERVRLTGGEPLLYGRVVEAVRFLSELGLRDVALTTNATRLAKLARPLRDAGLMRVNVSLDTLRPDRFTRITRGGDLDVVLRGIDAALDAGFDEVKLNAVVVRGENDDELPELVTWCWARGITPRLLELMQIGEGAKLAHLVVPATEMRARIAHLVGDGAPEHEPERGPARYLTARDGRGLRVGFITGTTDTYCDGCDRLRVASDGTLRPCLATDDGVSAASFARAGDAAQVTRAVREAWADKPDGKAWKGCTEPSAAAISMRQIGG